MNTEPNPGLASAAPAPACTLKPLIDNAATALPPDPAHGVKVTLKQVEALYPSSEHLTAVAKADDLLLAAAATPGHNLPLPQGSTLISAVLDFHLAGSPTPTTVELRPPVAHIPRDEATAPVIRQYLAAARFLTVVTKLANAAVILAAALCAATATLPDVDDDDDDPDGDTEEQIHPTRTHLCSLSAFHHLSLSPS
jgi:hypothetical protein